MRRDEIWFSPELNEWQIRYHKIIQGKDYYTVQAVRRSGGPPTGPELEKADRMAEVAFDRAERVDFA